MSRILMLVQTSVLDDARVRREVETLAADGHELTVLGAHPPVDGHAPRPAQVSYTGGLLQLAQPALDLLVLALEQGSQTLGGQGGGPRRLRLHVSHGRDPLRRSRRAAAP